MNDRFLQLCQWTQECIGLTERLLDIFANERKALIEFDTEVLGQTTATKQAVVSKIAILRKHMGEAARAWYGVESVGELEKQLEAERLDQWRDVHTRWLSAWSGVQATARQNQSFLEHSHKNIGKLVDHWRRALGETPLYGARGQGVQAQSTGKVITGKF